MFYGIWNMYYGMWKVKSNMEYGKEKGCALRPRAAIASAEGQALAKKGKRKTFNSYLFILNLIVHRPFSIVNCHRICKFAVLCGKKKTTV